MFGEKLLLLREQNNLSQVELANILGITQQCVSTWERGERKPSVDIIIKISSLFCCTIDYLLTDKEE